MNGASSSPAPTLPAKCLRLSLRMVLVSSASWVLHTLGEVLGVDNRHQRALEGEAVARRLLINGVVGARVLAPAAGAVREISPVALHARLDAVARGQVRGEAARPGQAAHIRAGPSRIAVHRSAAVDRQTIFGRPVTPPAVVILEGEA